VRRAAARLSRWYRLGVRRGGRGLAILATGSALLAWLPGSGADAAASVGSARTGVELKGTYSLSGAVSKHGSFVDLELVRSSCAQIGSEGTGSSFVGGPNEFAVPGPQPATGKAENIYFTAGVIYKGPGAFSKQELLKAGGTDLIVGANSYNAVAAAAKASMTVAANGSGSFTFSGAPPVKKGPSLSGKVSWTCAA
jgi:hypothetical protein